MHFDIRFERRAQWCMALLGLDGRSLGSAAILRFGGQKVEAEGEAEKRRDGGMRLRTPRTNERASDWHSDVLTASRAVMRLMNISRLQAALIDDERDSF